MSPWCSGPRPVGVAWPLPPATKRSSPRHQAAPGIQAEGHGKQARPSRTAAGLPTAHWCRGRVVATTPITGRRAADTAILPRHSAISRALRRLRRPWLPLAHQWQRSGSPCPDRVLSPYRTPRRTEPLVWEMTPPRSGYRRAWSAADVSRRRCSRRTLRRGKAHCWGDLPNRRLNRTTDPPDEWHWPDPLHRCTWGMHIALRLSLTYHQITPIKLTSRNNPAIQINRQFQKR